MLAPERQYMCCPSISSALPSIFLAADLEFFATFPTRSLVMYNVDLEAFLMYSRISDACILIFRSIIGNLLYQKLYIALILPYHVIHAELQPSFNKK